MKKTLAILATFAMVVVFNTGCTAVSNLRLNEELTNLYIAQIAARDEDDLFLSATIESGFRSVSERAQKEAEDATTNADAISFYRIAATAAWQGRSDSVDTVSDAGWRRCEDSGVDVAPRDCFMLLTIPDLAATDTLILRLDKLNKEIGRLPEMENSDEAKSRLREEAINIFNSLENRFTSLQSVDNKFGDIAIPRELGERVTNDLLVIYCRMPIARGAMLKTSSMSDPDFVAARETLERTRVVLEEDTVVNCSP